MQIVSYIIPFMVLIIIIYAVYKKVDILTEFIEGAREGYKIVISIFPTILGMMLAINIFIKSNILFDLTNYLKPFFDYIKLPIEILPLTILKPISGSTSIVLLNEILNIYQPDSYIGILASVLAGSTDTTIYIISLYFGSIGIKKTNSSLKLGLLTDLCTVIIVIIIVNMLFA